MEEGVVSKAFDALLSVCDRLHDEPIDKKLFAQSELESRITTKKSGELLSKMRNESMTRQDLSNFTPSVIWDAVIELVTQAGVKPPPENTVDYEDFANSLSNSEQRMLGALFSACEYLLGDDVAYSSVVRSSLWLIFPGRDNLVSALFAEYRSYFPQASTFGRRVGRINRVSVETVNAMLKREPETRQGRSMGDLKADNSLDSRIQTYLDDGSPEKDSIIDFVMDGVDLEPQQSREPTRRISESKVQESSFKPRSSLVLRGEGIDDPLRRPLRSVSFSQDASREEISGGGVVDIFQSMSRISSKTQLAYETEERAQTPPPINPEVETISYNSASTPVGRIVVEDLEDDFDLLEKEEKEPLQAPVKLLALKQPKQIVSASSEWNRSASKREGETLPQSGLHTTQTPKAAESAEISSDRKQSPDLKLDPISNSSHVEVSIKAPPTTTASIELPAAGVSSAHISTLFDAAHPNVTEDEPLVSKDRASPLSELTPRPKLPSRDSKSSQSVTDGRAEQKETLMDGGPRNGEIQESRRRAISAPSQSPERSTVSGGRSVENVENEMSSPGMLMPKRADSFSLRDLPVVRVSRRDPSRELRKMSSSLSRPPLPGKSVSDSVLLASLALDRSMVVRPANRSEMALETYVTMEGWMEKKSEKTGFWQQRYYVLSESIDGPIVVKIYGSAVEAAWGMVPLQLKYVIPLRLIESMEPLTNKASKGREFMVHVAAAQQSVGPSVDAVDDLASEDTHNHNGTWSGTATRLHLRAPDPEQCLLWVSVLRKAKEVSL